MLINQTRLKEMGSSKSEQRIVTLKMVFGISHDRLFFSTTDKRLRPLCPLPTHRPIWTLPLFYLGTGS